MLGLFHGPERKLKINPEGGPHEKAIPFMFSFLLVTLAMFWTLILLTGFPGPFLKLNADANWYLCALL